LNGFVILDHALVQKGEHVYLFEIFSFHAVKDHYTKNQADSCKDDGCYEYIAFLLFVGLGSDKH
jgi:hypothetical protein